MTEQEVSRDRVAPLDYAPPTADALPPLPLRLWWTRLIVLSIYGVVMLAGVVLIVLILLV